VAALETAEEFGKRIYLEAWKRGGARAEKKVFLGDGSEWIGNLADPHFPNATPMVDLYHARQQWWDVARKLYPHPEAEQRRWMMIHQDLLEEGKIEELVAALRAIDGSTPEVADGSAGSESQSTGGPHFRHAGNGRPCPREGGLCWTVSTAVILPRDGGTKDASELRSANPHANKFSLGSRMRRAMRATSQTQLRSCGSGADYSCRSAMIGSIWAAREAGEEQAPIAYSWRSAIIGSSLAARRAGR